MIATLTAFACAAIAVLTPRPVAPVEGPAFRLTPGERARLRADWRARAARCPDGVEARALRDLLEAQGAAEAGDDDDANARLAREQARRDALGALVRAHGEAALDGCRARSLDRMREARAGALDAPATAAVLGRFPTSLERYGLEAGGLPRAPEEVIEALYLARWNVVFARPMVEGLDRVALRAYYGWLALHAEAASLDARTDALAAYAAVGGKNLDEARARLLFLAGEGTAAADLYGRLARSAGRARDRNHALAALTE